MRAKPIAGYPSRTEACLALRAQGLPTREIAVRLGLDGSVVAALIAYRKRRAGSATPAEGPLHENGRTVVVSNDVLDALLPHAARRRISVNQLARDLLAVIADDGLVDSVLDDAADLPSPPSHQVPA